MRFVITPFGKCPECELQLAVWVVLFDGVAVAVGRPEHAVLFYVQRMGAQRESALV